MFTGLVKEIGRIRAIVPSDRSSHLEIEAPGLGRENLLAGDSVAINGICLTAVSLTNGGFKVEAGWETIQRTTLRFWRVGDEVNLERALAVNGRLDGHWVAGHVDGLAEVRGVVPEGDSRMVEWVAAPEIMKYIAKKGSVALDGVSLTVADLTGERSFQTAILPFTLRKTTLGRLQPGGQANLEVDLMARYLERLLAERRSREPLDWDQLAASGFGDTVEGGDSSW